MKNKMLESMFCSIKSNKENTIYMNTDSLSSGKALKVAKEAALTQSDPFPKIRLFIAHQLQAFQGA
jgi:hypothetical protein